MDLKLAGDVLQMCVGANPGLDLASVASLEQALVRERDFVEIVIQIGHDSENFERMDGSHSPAVAQMGS